MILAHSPELIDGDRHRELLTRAFHTLTFGEIGVAGFFILSGYLISQSWEQRPFLADFFRNRALRIYPGFVVAALLTAFLFGPLGADPGKYFAAFDYVAFAKSVVKLEVPATPATRIGNGSLWTIQPEFQCYVLVAVTGLAGLSRRAAFAPLAFVPLAALFLWKGILFAPFTFYGYFLAGMAYHRLRSRVKVTRLGVALAATALLVGLRISTVTAWLAVCVAGAYLLFAFAFLPVPRIAHVARRGDLSYGAYLYAWPMQASIIHFHPGVSPWTVFALSMVLSYACGWISWHAVERPFLRLKKRGPKKQKGEMNGIEPSAS